MGSRRDSDAFFEAVTLVQRFVCAFERGDKPDPPLSGSLPILVEPAHRLALEGLLFDLARRLDRAGQISALSKRAGMAAAVDTLARRRLKERGPKVELGDVVQGRIRDIAARHGCSHDTLRRRIATATGLSAREWRRRMRIGQAVDLIRSGMKVASAAGECGYRSPSSFFVAFRGLTGATPAAVRAMSEVDADALKDRLMPWRSHGVARR